MGMFIHDARHILTTGQTEQKSRPLIYIAPKDYNIVENDRQDKATTQPRWSQICIILPKKHHLLELKREI